MGLEALKQLIEQAEVQIAEHNASKAALAEADLALAALASQVATAQAIVNEKVGVVTQEQADVVSAINEIIRRSQEVLAQLG